MLRAQNGDIIFLCNSVIYRRSIRRKNQDDDHHHPRRRAKTSNFFWSIIWYRNASHSRETKGPLLCPHKSATGPIVSQIYSGYTPVHFHINNNLPSSTYILTIFFQLGLRHPVVSLPLHELPSYFVLSLQR
jgi:hypothetical protein